jgi:GNAT superfamily N-acetyltransferase
MTATDGPRVGVVGSDRDWAAFRRLVLDYAASLGFDLCFQGFDDELEHLDAYYGGPDGVALLAFVGDEPVGCAGVRRFDEHDAELKRMWVHPNGRGRGIGRLLAERAVAHAHDRGYRRLLLDTLEEMTAARRIYGELGFREIDPYRANPIATARYLALDLARPCG